MSQARAFLSVLRLVVITVSLAVFGFAASSQAKAPVAAVNTSDGLGLQGYDPVAYFTAGKPTPGVAQYTYRWQGVTYRFASAEHRDRFQAAPERYLPQYGGYCAYAMFLNLIADIHPTRWAIVEGKLYLNNNWLSHQLWSARKTDNITTADQHWAVLPKTEATP